MDSRQLDTCHQLARLLALKSQTNCGQGLVGMAPWPNMKSDGTPCVFQHRQRRRILWFGSRSAKFAYWGRFVEIHALHSDHLLSSQVGRRSGARLVCNSS